MSAKNVTGWLPGLLGPTIKIDGESPDPPRSYVNFVGATKEDDATNDQTNILLGSAANGTSVTTTLSSGANNDVAVDTRASTVTVHGSGVEVSGIAGGTEGRTLMLVAADDVLLVHDEAEGSSDANRIVTGVGDALTVPLNGVVTLRYDTVANRWLVTAVSNLTQPGGYNTFATYDGNGQIVSNNTVPVGQVVGTTDNQTLSNKQISGSTNSITNVSLSTGVTGTLPGTNMQASSGSNAGSMSAADKTKLDGIQKQGSTTAISLLAIDWSLSSTFSKTIAVSSTFTFSNATDGQCIIVAVTAGSGNTVTWPTVKWAGGVAPTQTSSGTDVYTFVKIGSTIYGSVVQAMA